MTRNPRKAEVAIAAIVAAIVGGIGGLLWSDAPRRDRLDWFVVDSVSMEPTFRVGDRVGVAPREPALGPRDGDIVVAVDPGGGLPLLKRVVGVAGDTVAIEDAVLVVNGRPVDEPYVDRERIDGVYYGPVTVPPGHVLLMGDNRADSIDSRAFGAVPVADVMGIVVESRRVS